MKTKFEKALEVAKEHMKNNTDFKEVEVTLKDGFTINVKFSREYFSNAKIKEIVKTHMFAKKIKWPLGKIEKL